MFAVFTMAIAVSFLYVDPLRSCRRSTRTGSRSTSSRRSRARRCSRSAAASSRSCTWSRTGESAASAQLPPIMGGSIDLDAPPRLLSRLPTTRSAPIVRRRRGLLPPAATLDRMAYRVIAFAFPIWTFAVIAGAIWAQKAWGRYWGWDPKETWSFITWTIYAGYLHARSTSGWKGRPGGRHRARRLRLAPDHVLRREPVDRRAAFVSRASERRFRAAARSGGTVRAVRRPPPRRSALTGEACRHCGRGCSGSWASWPSASCWPRAPRTPARTR